MKSTKRNFAVSKIAFLALPALLLLGVTYGYPLVRMLGLSFGSKQWTIEPYEVVATDPYNWVILFNTMRLSFEVAIFCLLLGYPLACLISRAKGYWSTVLTLIVVLPLWTSSLVRSYAWMVLLGRTGIVNQIYLGAGGTEPLNILYNRLSVYLGTVHIMLPFMIFPLLAAIRKVDLRLINASRSLGAGPISSFLLIFVPLTGAGIAAGLLLVFILTLGFFVTPALLGGTADVTFVMLIERQVNELLNWEVAAAMSVILLAATLALLALYRLIMGNPDAERSDDRKPGKFGVLRLLTRAFGVVTAKLPTVPRTSKWGSPNLTMMISGISVSAFLLVPMLIIFPISLSGSPFLEFPPRSFSLRWFENYFGRPDWIGPTWISIKVAAWTTLLSTILGTLASIGLVRGNFPGKALVTGFLISPSIVPALIIAVAIYFQFTKFGLVGTMPGMILAHTVIAMPLVLILVSAGLKSVDTRPEYAARSLGASPAVAFRKITFPSLRPNIISAALFAFLTSFDDVVLALFISGTSMPTLPKRMWDGIRFEIDPTIAAASTFVIVLSTVCLVLARWASPGAGEKAS